MRGRNRAGPQPEVRRDKKDVFFPLEIGAYLRDTTHLKPRHHGAYALLLMAAWVSGGRLAMPDEQIRTITKLSVEKWATDRALMAAFFRIDLDGAWVHEGMQRRMRVLGIPVDLGAGTAGPAEAVAPNQGGGGAIDGALRRTRQEAARKSWEARRGGGSDANPDAKSGGGDANGHAKPDAKGAATNAKTDANLHANLNLNPRSSTTQLSSLDAPREEEERGSGGLENAGSDTDQPVGDDALVEELVAICGNASKAFASALRVCITDWRVLGLTGDAICIEVARMTDAKRDANPRWVPSTPTYYTPGLARAAAEINAGTGGPAGDIWDQRVESYRRTGFWMIPDWGGKPDSDAPNPAISAAVLGKHGFGKAA